MKHCGCRQPGLTFRLLHRRLAQVAHLMEINDPRVATRAVVEAARESRVIGAGEKDVVTSESGVKEPPYNSESHSSGLLYRLNG